MRNVVIKSNVTALEGAGGGGGGGGGLGDAGWGRGESAGGWGGGGVGGAYLLLASPRLVRRVVFRTASTRHFRIIVLFAEDLHLHLQRHVTRHVTRLQRHVTRHVTRLRRHVTHHSYIASRHTSHVTGHVFITSRHTSRHVFTASRHITCLQLPSITPSTGTCTSLIKESNYVVSAESKAFSRSEM